MNFVIFMPDEMRAECAGSYGHPVVRTPNLDRLAAEGTRFDAAYIQHPVCSPSRCSMFTGWYPHVAGHRTLWHLLRPHEPNLFKYLKQAGYDVRWYGKNDLLATASFPDSVTEALPPEGYRNVGDRITGDPDDPHYDSFLAQPFPKGPWDTADACCVRRGIDFLRGRHDRPFMLYLPLTLPHPWYSAPEPWHSMYKPEDVPAPRPPELAGKPMFHELIRTTRNLGRLDEREFRRIAAVYLGTITYVDHLFGELLKTLDETGLAEDTCVIHCSDHGDWAGEFGLVEKWPSALDDTIARVPFVIRAPDGEAGHVVDTPVELFDIMATVLELAAVECRHTHFARSLVPQINGTPGDAGRAAYAEGGYDGHEPHCFEGRDAGDHAGRTADNIYYQKGHLQQTDPAGVCRTVMVRTDTHKLIYRTADLCELYDMRIDPRELNNLHGRREAARVQRELEQRLLHFLASTSDVTPFDEDPRGLPKGGYVDSAGA
ncbi:MAG TPA: sulfatase-like hydrolase/transferase [Phycisphaerae bacterium]|nr:sulfatase-like hydrolase/transferase [Phycisphaerae bacterium]